eukprot:7801819-Pyramimonas_sp.AAC.1
MALVGLPPGPPPIPGPRVRGADGWPLPTGPGGVMLRRALVKYAGAGEDLSHERVFLNDMVGGLVTIATPDFDVYDEDMSDQNVFEMVRFLGDNGELPLGLGGARLHRFQQPPTDAE